MEGRNAEKRSFLEQGFWGRVDAAPIPLRGPAPMPIAGWRGNAARFFSDPWIALRRLHGQYGSLVALTDRHPSVVLAFGPEHNQPLLTDRESFAPFITMVDAPPGSALSLMLSGNVFNLAGERHAHERAVLAAPFHRKRVERWTQTITRVAEEHVGRLSAGDVLDVPGWFQGYTLDVMVRVVFGIDPSERRAEAAKIRALLTEAIQLAGDPASTLIPVDLPRTPYRRLLQTAERFNTEVRRLAETASPDGVLAELSAEPDSMLPVRLFTLLTAGHETTYTTLTWTLALLAQHPDILKELTEQLRPFASSAPTAERLRAVPLLDHVIKESLRIFPPAAYGARVVLRATELGGVGIPRGAVVIFSHYVTQHMPAIFPDPERFDPSRWQTIRPSPYEYLPFGGGPRACPGAEFARIEAMVMLATLLTRYWPEIPDGATIEPRLGINLRPRALSVRLLRSGERPPRPARILGGWNHAVRAPLREE